VLSLEMKTKPRLLIAFAALILIATYFVPIWKIDLNAPQYPERLGLRIWLDEIGGLKPNDLQNINALNHYIGMKAIIPESIPELKIMPFIIAFMIFFGLFNAAIGKPVLPKIWVVTFVVIGIAGLIDFYLWGYDYGHNLDPSAPIKVPGMTYQPPLIGSKQLLNIDAVSLPYTGGYIILFSILLTAFAVYYNSKLLKTERTK
jgi:copper chaperone NosL